MTPYRRRVLVYLGVPLALVCALLFLLTLDLGWALRSRLSKNLQALSQEIGRPATLGEVHLHLYPAVRLEIRDLAIAGQTKDAMPLFLARSVRMEVALFPLLRSLGKTVLVRSFTVSQPEVRIERGSDGTLSIADLLARPRKQHTLSEQDKQRLQHLRIESAEIQKGAIVLSGLARGVLSTRDLSVKLGNLALGEVVSGSLGFSLVQEQKALGAATLSLNLGPIPKDLEIASPLLLLQNLNLTLTRLAPAELMAFVGPPFDTLAKGQVSGTVAIDMPQQNGVLGLKMGLVGEGLVFAGENQKPGAPADLALQGNVHVALLAGSVRVEELALTLNQKSKISLSADLQDLYRQPKVKDLRLIGEGLTLEEMLSVLPPHKRPKGSFSGPVSLSLLASGDPASPHLSGQVDLSEAKLVIGKLNKPKGMNLLADLKGDLRGNTLDLERLGLTLGPLSVHLKGQIQGKDNLDLQIQGGQLDLGQLGKKEAKGKVELSGSLRKKGNKGSLLASLDLTQATLKIDEMIDKKAKMPMKIGLAATQEDGKLTLSKAEASLPGGTLAITGTLTQSHGDQLADLSTSTVDLDLKKLGDVLPLLRLPPKLGLSSTRFAADFKGSLQKPERANLNIRNLQMEFLGGRLRGEGSLQGEGGPEGGRAKVAPKITIDLAGDSLDLDRLLVLAGSLGSGSRSSSSSNFPEVSCNLRIASGKLGGAPLRELVLSLSHRKGLLLLKTLRGGLLGGHADLSGSSFDLSKEPLRYNLRGSLKQILLERLTSLNGAPAEGSSSISGKLSAEFQVEGRTGKGATDQAQGQLQLSLLDAVIRNASLQAKIVHPLLTKASEQKDEPEAGPRGRLREMIAKRRGAAGGPKFMNPDNQVPRQTEIRSLALRGKVVAGKIQLSEALRFESKEGQAKLDGVIGLDQSVDLRGELLLSPEALANASGGQFVAASPVPVPLAVRGVFPAPEIELLDLKKTLRALLASMVRGRLTK